MKALSIILMLFGIVACGESQTTSSDVDYINEDAVLIDVRTPGEFEQGSVAGAINIPVDNIPSKSDALPKEKSAPIIVFCLSGGRSSHAKVLLEEQGYTNVTNGGTYKQVQAKLKKARKTETNKG